MHTYKNKPVRFDGKSPATCDEIWGSLLKWIPHYISFCCWVEKIPLVLRRKGKLSIQAAQSSFWRQMVYIHISGSQAQKKVPGSDGTCSLLVVTTALLFFEKLCILRWIVTTAFSLLKYKSFVMIGRHHSRKTITFSTDGVTTVQFLWIIRLMFCSRHCFQVHTINRW